MSVGVVILNFSCLCNCHGAEAVGVLGLLTSRSRCDLVVVKIFELSGSQCCRSLSIVVFGLS